MFDSSGPEGKVRGTPQQIIDKYTQLARDATLAGDRVATENFYQHAEHYLRMLGEAQRDQENRREQQEAENRNRQAERDRDRAPRPERDGNGNGAQQGHQAQHAPAPQPAAEAEAPVAAEAAPVTEAGDKPDRAPEKTEDKPRARSRKAEGEKGDKPAAKPRRSRAKPALSDDVIDTSSGEDDGSMLVETPEDKASKPAPRKRAASSRSKKPTAAEAAPGGDKPSSEAAE
ncbi:DUF4167 domain-containing protein [Pseudooceanicola endophyticus]